MHQQLLCCTVQCNDLTTVLVYNKGKSFTQSITAQPAPCTAKLALQVLSVYLRMIKLLKHPN